MSTINPHYTFQYSQPGAYRFSHDSVFFARWAFEHLRGEIRSDWQVLDLCAGCGIVGMDFLFHCKNELKILPQGFDFLEVQGDYEPHFEDNKNRLDISDTKIHFIKQNYIEPIQTRYNLILCNPPYFNPGEGKLSPNRFKNRCRFFIDATHDELVASIEATLLPTGRAYVLTRTENPPAHPRLSARTAADIRGTSVICYERTP